jgi:rubrerythrin
VRAIRVRHHGADAGWLRILYNPEEPVDAQTTPGAARRAPSTAEIIEGLNDLLQLDHDAVGAYEIAIQKLQDRDHADQIAGFRRDHERHIRDLNNLIAELGGSAVNSPHATAPLKNALQRLGAAAGDKGVLVAWRANEVLVRTKYDSYASEATFWPDNVKRVIDRNALDEERHLDWGTQVLNRMGVPTAEGLESGVATRARELGTQVESATQRAKDTAAEAVDRVKETAADAADRVKETASDAADRVKGAAGDAAVAARHRVADGMDAAADRIDHLAERRAAPDDRAGQVGHRVASGMHSGARYVRNADLERIRMDMERSARERPIRTLGILFATGFVIGRLLR